ncbi:HpcH/HpaI aldolase family protein [Sphingobium phenoxybenzoativorans]|uniref:HpcH/HpaI aldolase family protein n=1 Tax=Sphingobium phenoxybenzoativorans TaxID=1592790 RepID=UPI000872D8C9|nr:aldolase/citrate lyase family protein [Sphingobium phenoxybenzoativorans]
MADENKLRQMLASGRTALGCIHLLPSADVTELLALSGFDYIFIDHEHGPAGLGELSDQLRAAKAGGAAALVRMPSLDPHHARRLLDSGVEVIYCPMIESADQAEAFVKACRYPPDGERGAGGGTRAAHLGLGPDQGDRIADRVMLIIAIETLQAVRNLREIAAVPGIDAIFIGARDLSASMGRLGQFQDAELLGAVAECEAIIKASGKYMGAPVYPGLTIAQMVGKGYAMLLTGIDTLFLTSAARASLI